MSRTEKKKPVREKKIRVLLVEDNRLLRDGMLALLDKYDDISVQPAQGTNEIISQKLGSFKPDVMLLDLGLRNQNSLQLVKSTRMSSPATKAIVMDLIPTQEDVLEFVRAGVAGFILKDATVEDFLTTIRSVARGEKVLPSLMTESLFSQIIDHALNGTKASSAKVLESVRMTRRERQVIGLISEGMANKEIALQLNLSTYTVKSHVHNILEKLTLHSRVQIARFAHDRRAVEDIAETVTLLDP